MERSGLGYIDTYASRSSHGQSMDPLKGMMSAILLFEDRICASGVRVLHDIEHVAGRECLTKGYAKLQTICSTCVKIAGACKTSVGGDAATLTTEIRSCILFVLQAILFQLYYEQISSKSITIMELDSKRDDTPGLVHLILARRAVLGFVQKTCCH
jgi:hypothetical protein